MSFINQICIIVFWYLLHMAVPFITWRATLNRRLVEYPMRRSWNPLGLAWILDLRCLGHSISLHGEQKTQKTQKTHRKPHALNLITIFSPKTGWFHYVSLSWYLGILDLFVKHQNQDQPPLRYQVRWFLKIQICQAGSSPKVHFLVQKMMAPWKLR